MKLNIYTLLLTTLLFLISCGSTKKIVSEKQVIKEVITDTIVQIEEIIDTTLEIEEPTIIKEEDINNIKNKVEQFNHTIFNTLLEQNVSKTGETNYRGFIKKKTIFKSYLTALSENLPTEKWTKEDKLAYWMNTYNAFTIKLIIDNYPTQSIKDIKNAWDSRFFRLGKKWYNLSEIEHKILRKIAHHFHVPHY